MTERFVKVKKPTSLKAHILNGYDVTSKLRTKAVALKANLELDSEYFGEEQLSKQALHLS